MYDTICAWRKCNVWHNFSVAKKLWQYFRIPLNSIQTSRAPSRFSETCPLHRKSAPVDNTVPMYVTCNTGTITVYVSKSLLWNKQHNRILELRYFTVFFIVNLKLSMILNFQSSNFMYHSISDYLYPRPGKEMICRCASSSAQTSLEGETLHSNGSS